MLKVKTTKRFNDWVSVLVIQDCSNISITNDYNMSILYNMAICLSACLFFVHFTFRNGWIDVLYMEILVGPRKVLARSDYIIRN